METYFFHYPQEKDTYTLILHILSLTHNQLLSFFNLTNDLYTFLTLLPTLPDTTLSTLLTRITTSNPYEALAYNIVPTHNNILSTFFLQFIAKKPTSNIEDRIVFHLYKKNYKKVNSYLLKIRNHRCYMYLTLCQQLKLKECCIINALDHINPDILSSAITIINDKDLVTSMAIIKCDSRQRIEFLKNTMQDGKENRFRVTKILQKMYFHNEKVKMYDVARDCMRFVGVCEDEEFVCSWLRVFYVKNRRKFGEMMKEYGSVCVGEEFKMWVEVSKGKNVGYEGYNRYAAVRFGMLK